jgi:hypothetical protein
MNCKRCSVYPLSAHKRVIIYLPSAVIATVKQGVAAADDHLKFGDKLNNFYVKCTSTLTNCDAGGIDFREKHLIEVGRWACVDEFFPPITLKRLWPEFSAGGRATTWQDSHQIKWAEFAKELIIRDSIAEDDWFEKKRRVQLKKRPVTKLEIASLLKIDELKRPTTYKGFDPEEDAVEITFEPTAFQKLNKASDEAVRLDQLQGMYINRGVLRSETVKGHLLQDFDVAIDNVKKYSGAEYAKQPMLL